MSIDRFARRPCSVICDRFHCSEKSYLPFLSLEFLLVLFPFRDNTICLKFLQSIYCIFNVISKMSLLETDKVHFIQFVSNIFSVCTLILCAKCYCNLTDGMIVSNGENKHLYDLRSWTINV